MRQTGFESCQVSKDSLSKRWNWLGWFDDVKDLVVKVDAFLLFLRKDGIIGVLATFSSGDGNGNGNGNENVISKYY